MNTALSILMFFICAVSFGQIQAPYSSTFKNKADSLFDKKEYASALAFYRKALKQSDKPRLEYYKISVCHCLLSNYDSACTYMKMAIKNKLKYAEPQYIDSDENLKCLKNTSCWSKVFKKIHKNTTKYASGLIKYPFLKKKLLKKRMIDQKYRNLIKPSHSKAQIDSLWKFQAKIDNKNTAWLKQKIKKYGWLGIKEVGVEGDDIAWLLVQHADLDTIFQQQVLDLLASEVKKNNTDKKNFAYLTDRVMVAKFKTQVYGTQVKRQIKDENNKIVDIEFHELKYPLAVDSLRKSVGLPTLLQYKEGFIRHFNR
jgi:tetratricopeptide (TPR) repeat protein